jgi:DNA-binding response OmpR family regulator
MDGIDHNPVRAGSCRLTGFRLQRPGLPLPCAAVPSLLIVDDDDDVLRPLTRYLASQGYEVTSYTEFESARQDIPTLRPDIVITDVRLGAFNGLQLAILARDVRPDARVVVFSGFDDPVLKEEARRIGATYLMKPVSGRTLVDELRGGESG